TGGGVVISPGSFRCNHYFTLRRVLKMKKVIAPCLVLGLFAAAPVMAAEDSILAGVSQYEVSALADAEMSQIQGEQAINLLRIIIAVKNDPNALNINGLLGGLLVTLNNLLGGVLGGVLGGGI
ncbi:MAG: hypothetical protein ACRER2_06485, partial [Methylococcales bacterium]